jgi:predicted nucleic acid-binding protein
LDTVTLVRYLTNSGKLSSKVKEIFDRSDRFECEFAISTISLMEIMYLAEKNRIPISLGEVLEKIRLFTMYNIINLSTEIRETAQSVRFYEMHDRLILATAKYLDIPIISPDAQFIHFEGIEVIW